MIVFAGHVYDCDRSVDRDLGRCPDSLDEATPYQDRPSSMGGVPSPRIRRAPFRRVPVGIGASQILSAIDDYDATGHEDGCPRPNRAVIIAVQVVMNHLGGLVHFLGYRAGEWTVLGKRSPS
jgi:hypothetical protein